MSRRPFIPLEDTQHTSKSTSSTANVSRWVWPRDPQVGGHALLDMRHSTIQRWLSHSETDIKSAGKWRRTLVSARVFRQAAGRREGVFGHLEASKLSWPTRDKTFRTACTPLVAAGHDPQPAPILGMPLSNTFFFMF